MSYQKGLDAEEFVKAYLIKQGLKWLQSRYRSKFGEIDLVMQDKNCLIFVEVKYRKSTVFGSAYESVTWQKQRKLQLTALQFLAHTSRFKYWPARFDVVGLQGEPPQIEWIKNAFGVS
jgi:putative endonuclease